MSLTGLGALLTMAMIPGDGGRSTTPALDALRAIQGDWTMVALMVNGEAVPDDEAGGGRLTIAGDSYRPTFGTYNSASTIRLDPVAKPPAFDATFETGPQKGQTARGVYRVEGDTLTLCRGLSEVEARPDGFDAPADSSRVKVVWKRVKRDEPAAVAAEVARFQGTWRVASVEADDGKGAAAPKVETLVTFVGRTHTVRAGGRVVARNVPFAVDPSKDPRWSTDSLDGGKQIRGIYRLEGETLTSCVGPVDGPRPDAFAAKAGSGRTIRVLKRVDEPDDKALAIEAELKRFEGSWSFRSIEIEGKALPAQAFKGARLTFRGREFVSINAAGSTPGTIRIDPTAVPKTIDTTVDDGPDKGETLRGIYELTDDSYRVSLGLKGQPRPAGFSSKPGSGNGIQVLRRDPK